MPRTRLRLIRHSVCVLFAGMLAFSLAQSTTADDLPPSVRKLKPGQKRLSSIMVTVVDLKDRSGRVGCALFDQEEHWLTPKAIAGVKRTIPSNHQVICEFRNVPRGRYAVAITHDEDDDGEVDRGLFGIPSEGYCTSRNAKANFGPPTWKDASFRHDPNKPSLMRASMRY